MDAREFFNSVVQHYFGHSSDYGDWTKSYWDLEFVSATVNDCSYTFLEEWQDENERTCEICGHVHGTNESGHVTFCANEDCKDIQKFFGFTSGKRPMLACGAVGSDRSKRVQWLRKMLSDLYDAKSIYGIPKELRMACLYSMKLARMANEHSRTGNSSEVTDAQPIYRQEQGETFVAGNSSIH